jgi:alpha-amylase
MIIQLIVSFICISLLLRNGQSHLASEWTNRTIYQVLTDRIAYNGSGESCKDLKHYCGGTYDGIISQLDYIQGMGFDALWISPFLLNQGEDYHGYGFVDLYQLSDHFGSEKSLKSLISEAHQRNIWVMLDVVGNHVGPIDEQYQLINPFNQSQYYHSKCQIVDWNDQSQVEYCRLSNLPDLDQTNEFVKDALVAWVSSLKDQYNFDGLRIDTIPEVNTDFWDEFVPAANMYCVGEVFNGNIDYVAPYQNHVDGVLSYPLYYTMLDVYASQQSMYKIQDMVSIYLSICLFNYLNNIKLINYTRLVQMDYILENLKMLIILVHLLIIMIIKDFYIFNQIKFYIKMP